MNKEDISLIAQIISAIEDSLIKLERAEREKNFEELAKSKREILKFYKEIDKVL